MKRIAFTLLIGLTAIEAWAGDEIRLLVGTYTDSGSKGIYSLSFDQESGRSLLLDSLEIKNPSYLTISKDGRYLYAVSENSDATAALNAIRFHAKTGKMRLLNTVLTHGEDPCHVETKGRIALTANYTGGSMSVFPIGKDGRLGNTKAVYKGNRGGERPQQSTAHIHMARFLGDGHILATDFSADQLLLFGTNTSGVSYESVAGRVAKNSGPRHIELSKDEKTIYVMSELAGTVTVFANDHGTLKHLQTIASDSVNGGGGADIHLSPDGKFLYSSNRLKADGISIFKVNPANGLLTKVGYQLTGTHPRNFCITPNGKYLLCACRDSNVIEVYSIDPENGLLRDTHQNIVLKKPVCVKTFVLR